MTVKNQITKKEISYLADILIKEAPNSFEFSVGKENFSAKKVELEENFRYAKEEINLLGKSLEYKINGKDVDIPITLQLYENRRNHYRIFGYTFNSGMLFSVNLTTASKRGDALLLHQTLKITTKKLSKESRYKNKNSLTNCLLSEGFTITDTNKIILGYYDIRNKSFLDTSATQFIKDFVKISIIKGHFMANKGYSLPFLNGNYSVDRDLLLSDPDSKHKRQIPLTIRYQILERSNGKCALCGRSPKDGIKLQVDHIIPFSKGGKTELGNLQTLCQACNLGKKDKSQKSFL